MISGHEIFLTDSFTLSFCSIKDIIFADLTIVGEIGIYQIRLMLRSFLRDISLTQIPLTFLKSVAQPTEKLSLLIKVFGSVNCLQYRSQFSERSLDVGSLL